MKNIDDETITAMNYYASKRKAKSSSGGADDDGPPFQGAGSALDKDLFAEQGNAVLIGSFAFDWRQRGDHRYFLLYEKQVYDQPGGGKSEVLGLRLADLEGKDDHARGNR